MWLHFILSLSKPSILRYACRVSESDLEPLSTKTFDQCLKNAPKKIMKRKSTTKLNFERKRKQVIRAPGYKE
jgi:hypothetical protein